jgi:hypothetical protein
MVNLRIHIFFCLIGDRDFYFCCLKGLDQKRLYKKGLFKSFRARFSVCAWFDYKYLPFFNTKYVSWKKHIFLERKSDEIYRKDVLHRHLKNVNHPLYFLWMFKIGFKSLSSAFVSYMAQLILGPKLLRS